MRTELVRLSLLRKSVFNAIFFGLLALLYLVLFFGVGFKNLPDFMRPQTDYFLWEEMTWGASALFAVLVVGGAVVAGAVYGVVSALLYNASASLVGGLTGWRRDLD